MTINYEGRLNHFIFNNMRDRHEQPGGPSEGEGPSREEAIAALKQELDSYNRPEANNELLRHAAAMEKAIADIEAGRETGETAGWLASERAELEAQVHELRSGLALPPGTKGFDEAMRAYFGRELQDVERLLQAISALMKE